MADTSAPNRPLSPHLQVYRWQMNSVMSIFHRLTGIGMAVTLILLVWWFLAAATSPAYFTFVDGLLTSWLGRVVMLLSLWAFWYHFFNGVRHLRWDLVKGLGMAASMRTGWYAVVLSFVLSAFTIWITC